MPIRTFEEWIQAIFDQPVTDPRWWWDPAATTCEEDDETNVEYLTRLFSESHRLLRGYSDAQVGQTLWMIADPSCSDYAFSISDGHAKWENRKLAIQSIYHLNKLCFEQRCERFLAHKGRGDSQLNSICYMWWDIFPNWGYPEEPGYAAEACEYLDVMRRCLSLDNVACVEGALHGLGHMHYLFPEKVEEIIGRFLGSECGLSAELVEYATRARVGGVQ